MMRSNLRKEVNCDSCDHLLYLMDRDGDVRGYDCENDFEVDVVSTLPLCDLQCHSLYELYEMEQERIGDAIREEG